MNTTDIKAFIIGVLVTIIITLVFLLNDSWHNNKNGRYQFSPLNSKFVIDTQTGSVKVINRAGVPFEGIKNDKYVNKLNF